MRDLGWVVGALALVVGCGSTTPEASSANEEKAENAAPAADDAATEAPVAKKDTAPADDAKGPESSSEDLNTILQRVIEDEELDKFLHLSSPGRFPLQVAGKSLPSGLSLTKAGQPVKVVDAPSSKKDAVLVFTKIDAGPKEATVAYRYDIEGITGNARVQKTDHGWELANSRIVEH